MSTAQICSTGRISPTPFPYTSEERWALGVYGRLLNISAASYIFKHTAVVQHIPEANLY
ncbi:MAG TPA: hypothetical protein PLK31_10330 [Chloroflexota bacterium]|nr:hypothetical protein [Chloroflexota bacterium]